METQTDPLFEQYLKNLSEFVDKILEEKGDKGDGERESIGKDR